MRVLLDSNVLARSAYSLDGPAADVLVLLKRPDHTLVASAFVLEEVGRVLQYPRLQQIHGLSDAEIDRFVADVARACLVVEPTPTLAEGVIAADPDDDPIVAAAIAGKVEVLCTLDKHFYHDEVVEFCTSHGIRIMSDVKLLALLRAYA